MSNQNTGSGITDRRYLLWDASAVISYYLPQNADRARTSERITTIIDAGRHHRVDVLFYIPSIVVAEVFVAFDRHFYSTWEPQVFKKYGGKGKSLHGARYKAARRRFRQDIHNGALFYQYELNRYHILGLDLIAPIDKHRKFYRKGSVRSMGASDLLVGAMAMHLAKLHGRDRVALLTTDRRMEAIFTRASRALRPSTAEQLGLISNARSLGFGSWTPDLYPHVIDVARCGDGVLRDWFGVWPLPTTRLRNRQPKA